MIVIFIVVVIIVVVVISSPENHIHSDYHQILQLLVMRYFSLFSEQLVSDG